MAESEELLNCEATLAAVKSSRDHWREIAVDATETVRRLRKLNRQLAERVAAQSELLSKKAERPAQETT